ncbi:MAG: bacterial transcriptional activator domain-containing protein [Nitrospiraceae bacterium]|nr:bacterial transcriptional activator domain-containing protein [Nitrospiraceae bacterium]
MALQRPLENVKAGLGPGRRISHVIYYHQLSWFNLLPGNPFEAKIFAKKAVALAKETGAPIGEAVSEEQLSDALWPEADGKGLEADDLAEDLYRGLMACYNRMGRRPDALSAYERCKKTLSAALGIQPSPETERLKEDIFRN